ncbi:uncharacterized protein C8Q71DRAFT_732705 [Rhodofomes roseus]|uniref:Uncharacterized protein n=1 Tax=Rhodofomes roseus TaxID=34475 RepID=A0ABQ8KTL3_9APHY|nr:uncharacterized protein C8Q71DRAFT_732705 [Rhodofomes roseus]KAH9842400.1 hypothetical protein C8Q71DRAFT_732705 [Rhodofomes roseus]
MLTDVLRWGAGVVAGEGRDSMEVGEWEDEGREVGWMAGAGLGETMLERVGVTGERLTGGADTGGEACVRVDGGCGCSCASVGGWGVGSEPGSARLVSGEPVTAAVTAGHEDPPWKAKYELSRMLALAWPLSTPDDRLRRGAKFERVSRSSGMLRPASVWCRICESVAGPRGVVGVNSGVSWGGGSELRSTERSVARRVKGVDTLGLESVR